MPFFIIQWWPEINTVKRFLPVNIFNKLCDNKCAEKKSDIYKLILGANKIKLEKEELIYPRSQVALNLWTIINKQPEKMKSPDIIYPSAPSYYLPYCIFNKSH